MAALDRDKYEDAIGHFTEAAAYYIESYNNCSVGCEIGHDTVRENDRNHEAIGAIAGIESCCSWLSSKHLS